MRVLTIFIDMIRANRLSTFNSKIVSDTPLDLAFKEFGGTIYTNCFTPGPDTPRGMSAYYTGINPYENGCNTRLKWPQYFLNQNLRTVFDVFLEKQYKIDCFSSPKERDTGLFPEQISKMDIHNKDLDLNKYLSKLKLEENHFVFISIPDYHWAFDDFGYSTNGEKQAYKVIKNVWDIIFKNLNKDEFDHIFVFSDHGFKFSVERKLEPEAYMLNEDRTNIIMLHRQKAQSELFKRTKLCSLTDLYATYEDILNEKKSNKGISLLSEKEHDFIIVEDHIDFTPSINQNIELWALLNRDLIYIRELDKVTIINRQTRKVSYTINKQYDDILKVKSSFGKYMNEYEKIFLYKNNIPLKDVYMNGKIRKNSKKFKKFINIFFDLIKYISKKE